MAKPTADRRPRLAHDSLGSACILSVAYGRYLKIVRKLLVEYQYTGGVKHPENDTAVTVPTSHAIHKRLQTLQYQIPTNVRLPNANESEALAALTPKVSMEGHGV
jgi:hypothetical protein